MISIFRTVRRDLKVTRRKIVHRGIRRSVFLLFVFRRCLLSFYNIARAKRYAKVDF